MQKRDVKVSQLFSMHKVEQEHQVKIVTVYIYISLHTQDLHTDGGNVLF